MFLESGVGLFTSLIFWKFTNKVRIKLGKLMHIFGLILFFLNPDYIIDRSIHGQAVKVFEPLVLYEIRSPLGGTLYRVSLLKLCMFLESIFLKWFRNNRAFEILVRRMVFFMSLHYWHTLLARLKVSEKLWFMWELLIHKNPKRLVFFSLSK